MKKNLYDRKIQAKSSSVFSDDNKENIHCCCLLSNHDRISVFD